MLSTENCQMATLTRDNNDNCTHSPTKSISMQKDNSDANHIMSEEGCVGNANNNNFDNSTDQGNVIMTDKTSPIHANSHSSDNKVTTCASQLIESASTAEASHDDSQIKIKEEDIGNGSAATNIPTDCNNALPMKEEKTNLGGIMCVKKEENVSPHVSPAGFGSIGGNGNGNCLADQAPNSNKTAGISGHLKPSAVSTFGNENMTPTKNLSNNGGKPDAAPGSGKNARNGINEPTGAVAAAANDSFQIVGDSFSPANISMNHHHSTDYIQHQNHVFVFSTQLANKAAESVIANQFQNIIAYHCCQPSTQHFLEDFFSKNPAKINKFQRSSSVNANNLPTVVGPLWSVANQSTKPPLQSKQSNKMNFNPLESNIKPNVSSVGNNTLNTFIDSASGQKSDLLCWDKSQSSNLDGCSTSSEALTEKLLDSSGVTAPILAPGIKVPDEKLTPHQFQHRQEKLARMDKIAQILFPEERVLNDVNMNVSGNNASSIANTGLRPLMSSGSLSSNNNKGNAISCGLSDTTGGGLILQEDVLSDLGVNVPGSSTTNANSNVSNMMNNALGPTDVMGSNMGANLDNRNITHNNIILNSELINSFGVPNCEGTKSLVNQDMDIGLNTVEWTKMHSQFLDDRPKNNNKKLICGNSDILGNYRRSGKPGGGSLAPNASATSGGASTLRSNSQGPPPPYHPTQRPASEPIATQMSSPSSPNNPTSNLSLPSPRTNSALGVSVNSPNLGDGGSLPSQIQTNSATSGMATAISTAPPASSTLVKNCFSNESEAVMNRSRSSGGGVSCVANVSASANANSIVGLNNSPRTPVSHMSPKDLDTFTTNAGELKSSGPSPLRSRSPCNILDSAGLEARFLASPGMNFSQQIITNNQNIPVNGGFKGMATLERQNSAPCGSAQFCRRNENVPLNPNSNRPTTNKLNQSFDPITSLAQMSQQLTSCTPVSSGNSSGINMGEHHEISGNGNQGLDSMISGLNPNGMEQAVNNMSNIGGPFAASNSHTHMNQLIHPMGQRMSKMCGGPGPGLGPSYAGGFHSGMAPGAARMGGRMTMPGFNNFNVAPNIQVKASTPNTIQYMPVRTQNNNNNHSIRLPPNFDFLHRFPSSQNATIVNEHNQTSLTEQNNKMAQNNVLNNNSMGGNSGGNANIFQNYGQMHGMDDVVGLPCGGGMLNPNEMNVNQQLIRSMRPPGLRQPNMNLGPRMQAPTSNMGPISQPAFSGLTPDGLEPTDPGGGIFNNNSNFGRNIFRGGSQQKLIKAMQPGPGNMGMNSIPNDICAGGIGGQQGQQNPSVLLGLNNNNIIPGNVNSMAMQNSPGNHNNTNFKSYANHQAAGDIEYDPHFQQFQQQLYATTNNRNQQQQQSGMPNAGLIPNISPESKFFSNK